MPPEIKTTNPGRLPVSRQIESKYPPVAFDQITGQRVVATSVISQTMHNNHSTQWILVANPQPAVQLSAASSRQLFLPHQFPLHQTRAGLAVGTRRILCGNRIVGRERGNQQTDMNWIAAEHSWGVR